jgi:hypothetical protein
MNDLAGPFFLEMRRQGLTLTLAGIRSCMGDGRRAFAQTNAAPVR